MVTTGTIDAATHDEPPRGVASKDVPVLGPRLQVLIEARRPTAGSYCVSLADVDRVVLTRGPSRHAALDRAKRTITLAIPDRFISSPHAELTREAGEWNLRDFGSRNGSFVGDDRVEGEAPVEAGDLLIVGRSLLVLEHAALVTGNSSALDLCTYSAGFRSILEGLEKVAASDLSILVRGETGVGKEILARAIHARSRRAGPFIAVNCAALNRGTIEAAIHGHKKGAFSGAIEDSPGVVRAAHGGTLLLDEIGDLSFESQAILLRILQEREVHPVGSSRPIPVDVRFLSATHHDLAADVARGTFRADLLARVSGFEVEIPPLRHRRADLGELLRALLDQRLGDQADRIVFDLPALKALVAYDWPANVRELEQCIASTALLANDGVVRLEHLPPAVRLGPRTHSSNAPTTESVADAPKDQLFDPEELELKTTLLNALREHRGNIAAVARQMSKGRTQIHRWIRRFGLNSHAFR